jgi:hypothetical protein
MGSGQATGDAQHREPCCQLDLIVWERSRKAVLRLSGNRFPHVGRPPRLQGGFCIGLCRRRLNRRSSGGWEHQRFGECGIPTAPARTNDESVMLPRKRHQIAIDVDSAQTTGRSGPSGLRMPAVPTQCTCGPAPDQARDVRHRNSRFGTAGSFVDFPADATRSPGLSQQRAALRSNFFCGTAKS